MRFLHTLLLLTTLGAFSPAWAANERSHKLNAYQEPSDAEREAAKKRNRGGPQEFVETDVPEEYRFPWLQVLATIAVFAVAVPIGLVAFRRAAAEQNDANSAFAPPRKRRPE